MEYKIFKKDIDNLIRDITNKYDIKLDERLFSFALNTFKLLGNIPYRREYDVFKQQLSRSATSMGANYEEAQGAYSKNEFASKIGICLKEAKETDYFLRLIYRLEIVNKIQCERLLKEIDEIQKIFAAILLKVKSKK